MRNKGISEASSGERRGIPAIVAVMLALAAEAGAQSESVNACQAAVAREGAKYVRAVADTVGKCLAASSTAEIVDAGSPADAAETCAKSLRKIVSSAQPEKTLSGKFEAKLAKACDPDANPALTHLESEIYDTGPTSLGAANLADYCTRFGGSGVIDDFESWNDCIRTAADCQARQAIATGWPRALEYTAALLASPVIQADADALGALSAIDAAIEGDTNDDLPEIACGALLEGTCGDGAVNVAGEQCDGTALGGESCTSLGFSGGTLACSSCAFDTSGCAPATGNAGAADVLAGRTFSNAAAVGLVGTMTDNGAVAITPGATNQTIPAGRHDGAGYCEGDADLVAGNIRSGSTVFGVAGSVLQASGSATAGQVLGGQTFSNAGAAGLTGTMADNGAVVLTPGTSNQTIAAGFHDGSGYCAGDADLVAGNIRSGSNVLGVAGSVIQASGSAAAGQVLSGQTFSNAGAAGLTGAMTNNGAVVLSPGTSNKTIAAGYHDGSGYCAGDANLVETNLPSQKHVFGIEGVVQKGPLKTGNTQNGGPGSDGAERRGASRSYTDNGNGTITDNTTGLMWEKKTDDGSIHDKDRLDTWVGPGSYAGPDMTGTVVTEFLASLNSGSGFAGYTDWRLPNINELMTLPTYVPHQNPNIDSIFNNDCVPGCTIASGCSCTGTSTFLDPKSYWSSTTVQSADSFAMAVNFNLPSMGEAGGPQYARAVRGSNGGCQRCAEEGGSCVVTGSSMRRIRFGANGKYFGLVVHPSTFACDVATFGDPILNTVKHCDICEF